MTFALPRPFSPLQALRRRLARRSPARRAVDPLDDALCGELQSMRHDTQMLRLRDLRANPHLARDIGLEPDTDPCPPVVAAGGRAF